MSVEVVAAVKADLIARGLYRLGPCGAFDICARVGWQLRADGWGYITKSNPASNSCTIDGVRYGIDALAKRDGSFWVDMLINAENDNTPAWQLHPGSGQPSDEWAAPFDLDGGTNPDPKPDPKPGECACRHEIDTLKLDLEHAFALVQGQVEANAAEMQRIAELQAKGLVGSLFGVKIVLRPPA